MSSVWVVDDDQSIRFVLEKAFSRQQLNVRSFDRVHDVLSAFESTSRSELPRVLVSDIRMPEGSGIELLSVVKEKYPHIPVIIMTAYSDLDSTVSAFQGGAFEYVSKPFDLNHVVELVQRAIQENHPQEQVVQDDDAVDAYAGGLIGQSPAMQEVFKAIGRLSQSNVTVLITGESGTGKELIAQALHKHSPKAHGPFIAINTAAIPKDLLESELFGHEKGAFTGAQAMREGRFEQAAGGTLFLDEIGDMSFDLQTRLLRVLSEGRFYRVGGKYAIDSDVRVIAATHQNLEEMVKQGIFREDLFHRLNVIRLRLPSLKDRKEDIPLLTRHFLALGAHRQTTEAKQISTEALEVLTRFSYPGNVRQLENICQWLTVMTSSQLIQVKDLPPEVLMEIYGTATLESVPVVTGRTSFSGMGYEAHRLGNDEDSQHGNHLLCDKQPVLEDIQPSWEMLLQKQALQMLQNNQTRVWEELTRQFESCLINSALQVTQGKRIEAANKLGIGRNTITRKIQELGLDEQE